jgi:2-C-methyl-D-erythritol 4-phosphate cytidylyltransferase
VSLPATSAVLVAAGSSERMGTGERKPFLALAGRTVLEHACAAFDAVAAVREIVLVVHADDLARAAELRARSGALAKVAAVVAGGAARADSVRRGVAAAARSSELVAVHDAARALVRPRTIEAALALAAQAGAALVAVPVRDTLKRSSDGRAAEETVERAGLFAAQTPQVFRAVDLCALLERAEREGLSPTDDAALWERWIGPVPIAPGEAENLKITTPADLALAAAILEARAVGAAGPAGGGGYR